MKLDVLAIGAHPDDIELTCSGTLAKLTKLGYSVGILDLTRGELGTRGTPRLRAKEAADAARILGVKIRENLGLKDGKIDVNQKNILKLITVLRKLRPTVLLIPHSSDRHPDHEHTHQLAKEAWYYSGLLNIPTRLRGKVQERFRPDNFFEYMQWTTFTPSFIVDISEVYETRVAAINAFSSQFYNPQSNDKETLLSRPQFLDFVETRAKYFGDLIGVKYGEPFFSVKPIGVTDLFDLSMHRG